MVPIERPGICTEFMLKASGNVSLTWAVRKRQVMPTAIATPKHIRPDYAIARS